MSEKYQAYLCSREWGLRREAVIARSGGICERCKLNAGTAVHHKTYKRIYNEPLSDLIHLCDDCHDYIHGRGHVDHTKKIERKLFAPPGIYSARAVKDELVKGDHFLVLTLFFITPAFDDAVFADCFALKNEYGREWEKTDQRRLADLCLAVGIVQLNDSSQLLGKQFIATVSNDAKHFNRYTGYHYSGIKYRP